MEGTTPKQPPSSSVSATSSATSVLLQVTLISAQDLPRVSKSMKPYAIAWLNPNRKLTTQVDPKGNANPYWNEKLAFRVDEEQLYLENASLTVEIYTVSWFRDILAGIVKIPVFDLISPSMDKNRFISLQVRRPTGEPRGILNMRFCLGDDQNGRSNEEEEEDEEAQAQHIHVRDKIQIWRSRTVEDLDDDEYDDGGSAVNPSGSMVYGSDIGSDVGPSASVVAAEMMMKEQRRPGVQRPVPSKSVALPPRGGSRSEVDGGSSILEELTMEEAVARGWMDGFPAGRADSGPRKHNRRHSAGDGAFTCFGNVCGMEVQIACGSGNKPNGGGGHKKGHNNNRRMVNGKPHAKP